MIAVKVIPTQKIKGKFFNFTPTGDVLKLMKRELDII